MTELLPGTFLSIHELWEIYLQTARSQDLPGNTQRKDTFLDILLQLCMSEEQQQNALPTFSDVKSVCNQLCREFMSDIVKVTSSSQDEEDSGPLRQYLLEGRGWMLLKVIHKTGVQSLCGGRDLALLLVSLLPWCFRFPVQGTSCQEISSKTTLLPISSCFQELLKIGREKTLRWRNRAVPPSRVRMKHEKPEGRARMYVNGKHRNMHRKRVPSSEYNKLASIESDEESSTTKEKKPRRCKLKMKPKYLISHMFSSQEKQESDSEDDINALISNFKREHKTLSSPELCMLILDVVLDLCRCDLGQVSPVKYLSSALLPHLLHLFVSLSSDDEQKELLMGHRETLNNSYRICIQRQLLRAMFTACGVTAAQQNGVNILINHKIVATLLQVAVASKPSKLCEGKRNDTTELLSYGLVSDIVVGLTLCFDVVFQHLPFNPMFIRSAVSLFDDFQENQGFHLLKYIIHYMDSLKVQAQGDQSVPVSTDWLEDETIRIFGTFLNTLKIVKVNYIHSMKCVRRKHHKCNYSQYFDHHHDILGVSSSHKRSQNDLGVIEEDSGKCRGSTMCIVASCTKFLLDLLRGVTSKHIRLEILKTVYYSGVCCCMHLDDIISAFVGCVEQYSPAVRSYALETLNLIVLEHFSGGLSMDKKDVTSFLCAFCETVCINSESEKTCPEAPLCMDSGVDSSDAQREAKLSAFYRVSRWRPIRKLKSLMISKNEDVAISVAKHLLALAIKANPFLKAELFFSLYDQMLSHCGRHSNGKHCPAFIEDEGAAAKEVVPVSKSVQVHCLSALPYLLQANCVTKAFLMQKGVSKMLFLLADDVLRAPVLKVFEALVNLDERKEIESSFDVHDVNSECPCPYEGGQVINAFIQELSHKSFKSDKEPGDPNEELQFRISLRSSKFDCCPAFHTLPFLVDLWRTCAKLCLCSNAFVSQFMDSLCLTMTEEMLISTLQFLASLSSASPFHGTETEDSGLEWDHSSQVGVQGKSSSFFMLTSLLESLLVVCGSCYSSLPNEMAVCVNLWNRFEECFEYCGRLEPTKLKVIYEVIMNAAMPQYTSILEFSHSRNISLVYMRDDDIYDEDEVRQLLQITGSEDEQDLFTTETGYDADSEDTQLEDSPQHGTSKSNLPLIYKQPQKVYFPCVFRLLMELLVNMQEVCSGKIVLPCVMNKLLQNIRGDQNVAMAMNKADILSLMLKEEGFWDILVGKSEKKGQEVILAVVQQLAQSRTTSQDLRKLLQLFQHSSIPQERLLSVLLAVVEISPVLPQYSVQFPVKAIERIPNEEQDMLVSGQFDQTPPPATLGLPSFMKSVTSLFTSSGNHNEDRVETVPVSDSCVSQQEVWGLAAVQMPLRDSLAWPPFQNGFSFSVWVCITEDTGQPSTTKGPPASVKSSGFLSSSDSMGSAQSLEPPSSGGGRQLYCVSDCLHMVSVGNKEKMLELWADAAKSTLVFRLTSETADVGLVIQEHSLGGVVASGQWHHLMVSYVECLDGSTLTGKTTVVVDGWQTHSFVLDHPFSTTKSARNKTPKTGPYLCLGHIIDDPRSFNQGTWNIGQLMLFKGAAIGRDVCFHIHALGPDCSSISKCDCANDNTNYSPCLSKHVVLQSKIQYDILVGLKKVDLSELRSSVILAYNPKYPSTVSYYGYSVKGDIPGQLAANLGLTMETLLSQQPKKVAPSVQGQMAYDITANLQNAVEGAGGIASFLFLVAKVYESCHDGCQLTMEEQEKLQAAALRVLFTLVHHSSKMEMEFLNSSGHQLLSKVLTSSRSVMGMHVLKVIMDASTSESVYRINPSTNTLVLRNRTEAIIRDSSLIDQLLLNWQVWEGCDVTLMELLFSGLESLIREDHPHQTFNVKQYQVINIVNKIFKIYQERIQDGCKSLPVSVSRYSVSIVQSMLGSPPDYHLVMDMCDFLLLVHPAANTYINHSRSGFFFSLSWGLPLSPLSRWKNDIQNSQSTPKKNIVDKAADDKEPGKTKRHQSNDCVSMSEGVDIAGKTRSNSEPLKPGVHGDAVNAQNPAYVAKSVPNDIHVPAIAVAGSDQSEEPPISEVDMEEIVSGQVSTEDQQDGLSYTSLQDLTSPVTEEGEGYESDEMSDDDMVNLSLENLATELQPLDDLTVKFDEDDEELLKLEQGLITLCVGLLKMLASVIHTMPDKMMDKAIHKSIINPKILIVLAHTSSPELRAQVIQVLSAYLERTTTQQLEHFLKMDGFQLLSAQLFQYPTHQEQLEAAISMVVQRPFTFDEGLQTEVEELSAVQQSCVPVVLALLGNSTSDIAVCHNALHMCTQLFENSNVLATVMMECGLVEVLCNMVVKILEAGARTTDLEGGDENEIILADLQNIFSIVAVREFSASGPQHYQQFEDILTLLKELEIRHDRLHGSNSKAVQMLKIFQYRIVIRVLEVVEKASEDVSQPTFSLMQKQQAHQPSAPNPLVQTAHLLSLGGTFARKSLPVQRRPTATYYILSDQPPDDRSNLSGSGDSDSSFDSFTGSLGSVVNKRSASLDISQKRLVRSNSLLQSVLSIGKRKKLAAIMISQNELIDRLKKVLPLAVDMIAFRELKPSVERKVVMLFETSPHTVSVDRDFQRRVFDFTYRAFEATLPQEKSVYKLKSSKNLVMWRAKDIIRVQLGRLLSHLLSSRQEFDQKVYALSYMMGETRGPEVLKIITSTADMGSELGYHVHQLMVEGQTWLSSQQVGYGSRFINILTGMGHTVPSPRSKATQETREIMEERKRHLEVRQVNQKASWEKKRETALNRILHKFDSLSTQVSGHAMEVTQDVTQLQTTERNKFVTHIKQRMSEKIQNKKQWQEIVQNLTHERAVWFDAKSYPQSWQLNPTEGPSRVRKRLQRGHLGLDKRFLAKEYQKKLEPELHEPPLIYLFEDDHAVSDSPALIYQLHKNKKIRYTSTCWAVSPSSESKGELLIGEDSVFFVADEAITDANYTQVLLGNKDQLSMTWPYEDIREIHKRWYQLTDKGLEIFLTCGKTCLLAFKSTQERDRLYQLLISLELPNRIDTENLFDVLDLWMDGRMTNFEYLTHLNKISGRTFSDLMQYPVFPFILKDYDCPTLDLKDPVVYRDLSKPIAVQHKKSEERYIMNYQILQQEYEKRDPRDPSSQQFAPYHYGSHYSNSGTVLHYLVRLPPFTKMFISFQDRNFDIPDRTFHSVGRSWRLSSEDSSTDVKELIPEFFFLSEFLRNEEGFDFGKKQSGEPVWNVALPSWCCNDARAFILIHRQALESDYVTELLNKWIDLVFGYKQQGDNAIRAINVFAPATYYGIDVSSVKDALQRKALRTMIQTYGQTPKQLFKQPHPSTKRAGNEGSQTEIKKEEILKNGPFRYVQGLKWGSYLGSPDMPDPEAVWQVQYSSPVANLVALPTGYVFGISAKNCLLTQCSQEKAVNSMNSTDIVWAAILTWGHSDGIVRIINGTSKPAINFIQHSPFQKISCCVSVTDCRYLFLGGTSGVISIYSIKHNPAKESELQVFGHKKCLYGHTGSINTMVVCQPFSILVSGSQDKTCIIWDLNRQCYVRSVSNHKSGVKVVAVSDTSGDIASVSPQDSGSCLMLHTVNAKFVAKAACVDTINCLAFSSAPEGISINVIVGGLSTGIVRMWSSWDLSHLRDLKYRDLLAVPILSVTFTSDSQKLYISTCDCRVILWDYSGHQGRGRLPPKFKPYLYPT